MIHSTDGRTIWKELRQRTEGTCDRESCWLRQSFAAGIDDKELLHYTFAPRSPASWKKKPNEWLSSTDITSVMKRYEREHPDFEFLGPAPIDFDSADDSGPGCVWDEICKFNIDDCLKRGKYRIGFIFNTDPHYKNGSHWIAMFVNMTPGEENYIYYFDSNGDKCPKQIIALRRRIVAQGKDTETAAPIVFTNRDNAGTQHQQTDTECGMYCLYFITSLLTDRLPPDYFGKTIVRDRVVERHRKIFFS